MSLYVLHKDEKYCFAVLVFASYIFCFCITLYEMVLLQAWMGKMKPDFTSAVFHIIAQSSS